MPITYTLAPIPKWGFTDNFGRPLIGGKMYTYKNSNRAEYKAVYSDPGGNFAYPDPVVFDNHGMQGPFYWADDEKYYLEIYDSGGKESGTLQYTIENYPIDGGGGSNVTVQRDFTNLIVNSQFRWNVGTLNPAGSYSFLAPGGTTSFYSNITFAKSNTNVTDRIDFVNFSLGDTSVEGTPLQFLRYTASAVNAGGETSKEIQYFIGKVRDLENITVNISFSARSASLSTVELSIYQFFGNGGGASSPVETLFASHFLTASWAKYNFTTVIPSVGSKVLGSCGDDFVKVFFKLPLNTVCEVDHVNMQVITGNTVAPYQFLAPSQVDSVLFAPKTGDIKLGFQSSITGEPGWVAMADGSIGSSTSGATERANTDTFFLYKYLWQNVLDTWAPVSGGRGASPEADFSANKPMTLPRALGRALSSAGSGAGLTARQMGQYLGEETHELTIPEMPSHTHGINVSLSTGPNVSSIVASNAVTATYQTEIQGGNQPHNNMQPTLFLSVFIKL